MAERVLIVDDDDISLGVLEECLRDSFLSKLEVVKTSNGEEALEKFREFRPKLVISDMHMPKMDGISLFREIQLEEPGFGGFILMSGIPMVVIKGEMTAIEFLEKPLNCLELTRIIQRKLGLGVSHD